MATLDYSFYPLHPGEVLKDEMEARHISQREFARQVDMSYTVLNELLNGKRPLTPATALMFEAALDVPADALMAIQTKYNMQRLVKIAKLCHGSRRSPASQPSSNILLTQPKATPIWTLLFLHIKPYTENKKYFWYFCCSVR